MPCKLCGPQRQCPNPSNCPTYAKVPQPLKELIWAMWAQYLDEPGGGWLYANAYAPGEQRFHALWEHYYSPNHRLTIESAPHLIAERIYMAVKWEYLDEVWGVLLSVFDAETDVVQAKRCTVAAAARARFDTIVIYLVNKAGVWRFTDTLRRLRAEERLRAEHFNETVPPGTGRISDFRGVSSALQPASGESFGTELTDVIGEYYDELYAAYQQRRAWPSREVFTEGALVKLRDHGFDILKPWNRPQQVLGRDYKSV